MLTEQPSRVGAELALETPLGEGSLGRWVARGAVALAIVLFGALCLYQYHLPGLHYDEAFDVVPALQILRGDPVTLPRGVGIHLFGRSFPVMLGDTWGIVSTYAVLPLFWLLDVDVLAIRLWPILAGMLAVFLTYLIGRRIYYRWVGVGAALLLSMFPSYVFWTRVGISSIAHLVAIMLGIMLAYLAWRGRETRGGTRWLVLIGLLAGIGLATRLLFGWLLLAVPIAYAILLLADWLSEDRHAAYSVRDTVELAIDRLKRDLPFRSKREALAPLAGAAVGAFPVLYYNVVTRGSSLGLRANPSQTGQGVDNPTLWDNLETVADGLRSLLNGGSFWFYGGIFTNPLYPWVVAVSAVGLLVLVHRVPELRRCRRSTVFLLGFAFAVLLLSCFTVSIPESTRLLILLPIPQLLTAGFAVFGSRWLARKLRSRLRPALTATVVVTLLFVPLIARDLWVDARYHRALARSGGRSDFSSAIYDLAAYLDEHGITRPYALDRGVKWNIMILTQGRVEPLEIVGTGAESGSGSEATVQDLLAAPDPVILVRAEAGNPSHQLASLEQLVSASGRTPRLEHTFTQRDGTPVFHVFRVGE